jgi:hypothetical protein
VNRWLSKTGFKRGQVMAMDTLWRLSTGWYHDPRSPSWEPRSLPAVLAATGLTGEFWELPR